MSDSDKPLLIKRYASRRLYNTETSDYVTLDNVAGFIRAGRDVKIVDLKSGDDLTRQYLLQIIADHESRGDNVLPLGVLNDLVRSYASQAQSIVPEFLSTSFDMLRQSQAQMLDNFKSVPNPLSAFGGIEEMQQRQQEFLSSMMAGWPGMKQPKTGGTPKSETSDLDEIKRQLAELQARLSKMTK